LELIGKNALDQKKNGGAGHNSDSERGRGKKGVIPFNNKKKGREQKTQKDDKGTVGDQIKVGEKKKIAATRKRMMLGEKNRGCGGGTKGLQFGVE